MFGPKGHLRARSPSFCFFGPVWPPTGLENFASTLTPHRISKSRIPAPGGRTIKALFTKVAQQNPLPMNPNLLSTVICCYYAFVAEAVFWANVVCIFALDDELGCSHPCKSIGCDGGCTRQVLSSRCVSSVQSKYVDTCPFLFRDFTNFLLAQCLIAWIRLLLCCGLWAVYCKASALHANSAR